MNIVGLLGHLDVVLKKNIQLFQIGKRKQIGCKLHVSARMSSTRCLQLVMTVCYALVQCTLVDCEELTRRNITAYLLNASRYDPNIVPDFDQEYPTNVVIQITIHDMHSVSEATMEYSVDVYLRMWWRDWRLDYSKLSNKTKLELDSKNTGNVWQPDIFFENEKRATVHTVLTTNKLMHILTNGTVVYSIRISMALRCAMKLQYFPFDSQRCPLHMQSFGYTTENINLDWHPDKPIIISDFEMPQFQLVEDSIVTLDLESPYSDTGIFSTLKAEVVLKRKVGFYFLQVFVPSILLVALSWVSFWVDPNAVPARVSLGVTCVLTMTTQSSGIRQTLPPVSYVKAIDVWMFTCLWFVFAALLEFAYVNVLLRQKTVHVAVVTDGKKNVKETAKEKEMMVITQETAANNNALYKYMVKPFTMAAPDGKTKAVRVDKISRVVFPMLFILFLAAFFLVCGLAP